MGIPVVSTTVGAEGLGVQHDQDILLGETPGVACQEYPADSTVLRSGAEIGKVIRRRSYPPTTLGMPSEIS